MKSVCSVARRCGRCATGLVLAGLLLLTQLLNPETVRGQAADATQPNLALADQRVRVTLSPGTVAEGELRFSYDGPAPIDGQVEVLSYQLRPEGPRRLPPDDPEAGPAARWISTIPSNLTLRPGAAEAVRYRVQVPIDAPPGDHSALVLLETPPPGPVSGVRLVVNVPGEAVRKASLDGFQVERLAPQVLGYQIPIFLPLYAEGPVPFQVQLENSGQALVTPAGRVLLVDLFGNEVARLDLPPGDLLPGDSGRLVTEWTAPPAVGVFTARLSLETGEAPLVAEDRFVMLGIPWLQLLLALLFALALRLLLGRQFSLPLPGRRSGPDAAAPTSSEPRAAVLDAADPSSRAGSAESAVGRSEAGDPGGIPAAPQPSTAAGLAVQAAVRELVRRGQEVARRGDRADAYRLFVRAVEIDPTSEDAWLWRAGTTDDRDEAVHCLEWVLQHNPQNIRARRGLEEMQSRSAR